MERIQFAGKIASIDAPNHTYHRQNSVLQTLDAHSEASCFPAHCSIVIIFFLFSEEKWRKIFFASKNPSSRDVRGPDPAQVGAESESKQSERRCELRPLPRDKAMLRLALGDDLR
jgi:hypothetical protein